MITFRLIKLIFSIFREILIGDGVEITKYFKFEEEGAYTGKTIEDGIKELEDLKIENFVTSS